MRRGGGPSKSSAPLALGLPAAWKRDREGLGGPQRGKIVRHRRKIRELKKVERFAQSKNLHVQILKKTKVPVWVHNFDRVKLYK